jgi:hypothetical protein
MSDGDIKQFLAYKTSDLVVQSLFRSFSNSSTKASSFELDRQFYTSADITARTMCHSPRDSTSTGFPA